MAYESITYEVILQRMIDRVSEENPALDTREGSIIFNALASAAIELAIMYTEIDNSRSESFVPTASREYILLGCQDVGMDTSAFEASAGVHKAKFNVEVSIGSRWNLGLYNYEVTEYLGVEDNYYAYRLTCETLGSEPNTVTGDLSAITEMSTELNYAKLVDCLVEGEDETSDEEIIKSYIQYVNNSTSDCNVSQYKQWCEEYDGIGHYKIFPLWNGDNTVKVSILTASNRAASTEAGGLVEDFQNYLDPNSEGMGNGKAPIGAFVTVTTATEIPINVSANVVLTENHTDTSEIDIALTKYFNEIAYQKSQVSYMSVGAVILSVESVDSVSNVTINGGTSDINLGAEEIPILGETTWEVK